MTNQFRIYVYSDENKDLVKMYNVENLTDKVSFDSKKRNFLYSKTYKKIR